MKRTILIITGFFFVYLGQAIAQWEDKVMNWGGQTRTYRVYKSPTYNSSNPASLIIALHGLGDNATNFSNTLKFSEIADTANIICVYPQAVSDPFIGTSWNASAGLSGYYPNGGIDDIGFINAIIDTSLSKYSIYLGQIYLCGFSMGGFMTQKMAMLSNQRIAAIASISGTIGSGIQNPNPGRSIPVAHFHGVADSVVLYHNNQYGADAEELVDFWIGNNNCSPSPVSFNYPNLSNDGVTIERIEYSNGNPQNDVWFYRLDGANHFVLSKPQNDITLSVETWLFLKRHKSSATQIANQTESWRNLTVFPNPANNKLYVGNHSLNADPGDRIRIYNSTGILMMDESAYPMVTEIDISKMNSGVYQIVIQSGEMMEVAVFIIK